jgi:hypothetical protein
VLWYSGLVLSVYCKVDSAHCTVYNKSTATVTQYDAVSSIYHMHAVAVSVLPLCNVHTPKSNEHAPCNTLLLHAYHTSA